MSASALVPRHRSRAFRAAALVLVAVVASAVPTAPLGAPMGAAAHTAPAPADASAAAPAASVLAASVLAISVDGLNPNALKKLGPTGTPTLHRLIAEGASTLNARTAHERTETLPNHTGMVTGRRVRARTGGHGVEWNDDRRRPATVQAAAGHDVASVFDVVHAAGGSTAVFASKRKFSLWRRSWRGALDGFVIEENNARLVRALRADLAKDREFRMLHLSAPDVVGHRKGYMGRAYLRQVRATDALIGKVLATLRRRSPETVVVLTSDHGGKGHSHADARKVVNQRIPFIVWGPGVARGANLYALNPDYASPGKRRVGYAKRRQPVRNGALANLSLDLLGLPAVRGSEHDALQNLRVTSRP